MEFILWEISVRKSPWGNLDLATGEFMSNSLVFSSSKLIRYKIYGGEKRGRVAREDLRDNDDDDDDDADDEIDNVINEDDNDQVK